MPLTIELKQTDRTVGTIDDKVPRIDARELLAPDATRRGSLDTAIGNACRDTGFFYLEHAFGDASIYADVQQQMHRFFSLADDDPRKTAIRVNSASGFYGWTPMFQEPAYQPGTVAHMEAFDCGVDDAINQWPPMPAFARDVNRYRDALTPLADAILEALAGYAGFERRFFADRCSSREHDTLRLLHYPENDAADLPANVGIAAHTDFECITFITQTAAGLELTDVNGHWYDAPGNGGRIIVLLDDMLERWTNGFYKATGHRVRNTAWQRYSTVIFFAVDDDQVIEPLPEFVDANNPARYAAVSQAGHIDAEIARALTNRPD